MPMATPRRAAYGSYDMRTVVELLAIALPWRLKRLLYRRLLGYEISPTAYIGFSFLSARSMVMADGASIGHLNIIRGCDSVALDSYATIGNFNWISAYPSSGTGHYLLEGPAREPALLLEPHAAVTSRHIIDCTHTVALGAYATLAGYRSQLLTHSLDVYTNRQASAPVYIGRYAFVGTSTVFLPGARLPDYSILAARSLVRGVLTEPYTLYGGTPASKLRDLPADLPYFHRLCGYVE